MIAEEIPLLLEPEQLQNLLGMEGLVVIDLCKETTYAQLHIPGAIHLAYSRIVASDHPAHGLLPDADTLARTLSDLGIGNDSHVVAYDDEGGGNASRLLWTLEAMGHGHYSLLNGGLHAWANEGHACSRELSPPATADFTAVPGTDTVATVDYIIKRLGEPDFALWDARSWNEYSGISRFSRHPGHIPGAVNLDWLEVMDRDRNLRLKADEALRTRLNQLGLEQDKEIVAYCQTHHRSSLAWFVLRHLGYQHCRGYPGSWSEWGNSDDTPKAMP
ncbi:MAG: sulfurtransferase [Candidatus Thiodiazotropha endolucinida]|nr:sulfurtransferase [Candidatus Thiodiazotropha taylori]MCG8094787.1 sulfurtransferase [Candidatus Thiodiazotropha endolucinida]MCG8061898.1 sulfurtransferase [Candidatus Thiodiazotropha taylori]MCG8063464.1 sulfurtransferase [Candidatus Thiodiazotropha taylori]MCW4329548.1 sulfurtransferase [Candidatus Thiodiazotropha endolucinida]